MTDSISASRHSSRSHSSPSPPCASRAHPLSPTTPDPLRAFARDAKHQTPGRNHAVIFEFIVRRLRWLARVPLAPEFFDALLLAWTALFQRGRIAAMEALEDRALQLPGVRPCRHRFGG